MHGTWDPDRATKPERRNTTTTYSHPVTAYCRRDSMICLAASCHRHAGRPTAGCPDTGHFQLNYSSLELLKLSSAPSHLFFHGRLVLVKCWAITIVHAHPKPGLCTVPNAGRRRPRAGPGAPFMGRQLLAPGGRVLAHCNRELWFRV